MTRIMSSSVDIDVDPSILTGDTCAFMEAVRRGEKGKV